MKHFFPLYLSSSSICRVPLSTRYQLFPSESCSAANGLLHTRPILSRQPRRAFSQTGVRHDTKRTHYEVLGVPTNISQPDLKKKFYALSKEHHPDLHPSDPEAQERFQAISESYSIIGSAEKRHRYDRDVLRFHQQHSQMNGNSGQGGTYAGSRPASGLSKRRSAFRGPPPSYYAHGPRPTQSQSSSSSSTSDTHNPGATQWHGSTADFDSRQVYKTQTHEDSRRNARREAAVAAAIAEAEEDNDFWAKFVVVSVVLTIGITVGGLVVSMNEKPRGGGMVRGDGSLRRIEVKQKEKE